MAGTERRPTVELISLGCPKNRVDSEVMLGELRRSGYWIAGDSRRGEGIAGEPGGAPEAEAAHGAHAAKSVEPPGTVIVNTCGFIDEARQESIDAILEAAARKAAGEVGRLLVAGCMVNRYGEELAREIPEIDGFVGLDQLREVGKVVQLGGGPPPPGPSHLVFDHTAPRLLTTRGYAYLKVAEGCDNPCTFCAIPSWRGRFRSRPLADLVAEARELETAGVAELCLIAQDTTRYGEDLGLGRHGLLRLVEALLAATSIPWIRFLYAYPTTLDPELLRLMGEEERFVSYLDMPLQHSHREVLRAMRRGGNAERYLKLLDRARELVPDVFLRTTFIVGFPGETEERFEDLLEFVARARFDHLGAFAYSPEPGTPSAEMTPRVPRGVARRRHEALLAAQRPIALASRRRLIGRRLSVLVEGVHEETDHLLVGRHHGQAPEIDGRILINDGVAPAGTFAEVEVSEAHADDLVGHVVGPEGAPGVVPAAVLAAGGVSA